MACVAMRTLTFEGLNSYAFLRSSAGTSTPRGMNTSPELMAIALSGRWMPSKIVESSPGPSSTDRGLPVALHNTLSDLDFPF